MADDKNPQCPECFGTDLEIVNIRDVYRPSRKDDPPDAKRTVVARKIEVRCRECGCTDFILKYSTDGHLIDTVYRRTKCCDECGSDYIAAASPMSQLCPECSHWLYGYPRCPHEFNEGRCSICGWDGSVSDYVRGLRSQQGEP